MRSTRSKAVLRNAAQRAPSEWIWGGLGVGAATVSTTFAAYMLAFGPAEPNVRGTPDFGVFAHLRPRTRTAWAGNPGPLDRPAILARNSGSEEPSAGSAPRAGVDFTPTGSVMIVEPKTASPGTSVHGAVSPRTLAPLPGFVLKDVFDGKALVESRAALSLVSPGSMLDGAGEVLAIENRGDRWVVTTTQGVISGQPR